MKHKQTGSSVPSGKIYNRRKDKRKIGMESGDGFDADFCVIIELDRKVNVKPCGWIFRVFYGIQEPNSLPMMPFSPSMTKMA